MIDFSSCTHKRLHLDVIIHGSLTHVHISVDCSLALRSSGTWKQVTPEEDKAWKFLCLCYSQHVRDDNKPRMAFRALSCKMWRHRRFSNAVEMKSNENRLLELGTRYWRRDITRNEKKVYPPPSRNSRMSYNLADDLKDFSESEDRFYSSAVDGPG